MPPRLTSLAILLLFCLAVVACGPPGDDDDASAGDDDDTSDLNDHPFADGGEVFCEDPVSGFDRFTEATAERGIVLDTPDGGLPENQRTATVVAHDGDGDGDVDLFFSHPSGAPQTFANDGAGNFTAVPQTAAVPSPGLVGTTPTGVFGMADLTGDAAPDLVTIGLGTILFAPNEGELTFGDFVGLDWSPAAYPMAFSFNLGDVDADGDLDLFLPGLDPFADGFPAGDRSLSRLYRNDGTGLSLAAEVPLAGGQEGLSVLGVFTDRDADGDQDLFVMADRAQWGWPASAFYRNDGNDPDGDAILVDDAAAIGADLAFSGMGVDVLDMNGDGVFDYCMSDVGRPKCLTSLGDGTWFENGLALGLEIPPLDDGQDWSGWSTDVADFDNDGVEDLAISAAFPAVPPDFDFGADFSVQPDAIWQGEPDGTFVMRSEEVGFDSEHLHYGSVVADLDGDGYLEIVTSGNGDDVHVFWNSCGEGAWLAVDLVGLPPNQEAYGARVTVDAGGVRKMRELQNLRAFGQGPSQVHFGLGAADVADSVTVHWPDGTVTVSRDVPVRRKITIGHPDAAGNAPTDFGTGSDPFGDDDDASGDDDDAGGPTTFLSGTMTRSIPPGDDGVGFAFVFVFEDDPLAGPGAPIAEEFLGADLSAEGSSVLYSVQGIPVRKEPYYVMAVLDDDENDQLTAGDLYATDGSETTLPRIVADSEKSGVSLDIDLNALYTGP